jgi:hypothetical protein
MGPEGIRCRPEGASGAAAAGSSRSGNQQPGPGAAALAPGAAPCQAARLLLRWRRGGGGWAGVQRHLPDGSAGSLGEAAWPEPLPLPAWRCSLLPSPARRGDRSEETKPSLTPEPPRAWPCLVCSRGLDVGGWGGVPREGAARHPLLCPGCQRRMPPGRTGGRVRLLWVGPASAAVQSRGAAAALGGCPLFLLRRRLSGPAAGRTGCS